MYPRGDGKEKNEENEEHKEKEKDKILKIGKTDDAKNKATDTKQEIKEVCDKNVDGKSETGRGGRLRKKKKHGGKRMCKMNERVIVN